MEFDLHRGTEILERTPGVLRSLLEGLPDAWTTPNEGADTWSPRDVVAHMVHIEEVDWIPRVRIVLEDGPGRPFDPVDRFAFRTKSAGRTLPELLDRFDALRARSLGALGALDLSGAALRREGTHPALGTVRLSELLATWVVHDLTHLAQIVRVMAKQYAAAVGPWKEYLSVLRSRGSKDDPGGGHG